jgi:hypothetical protein
MLPWPGPLQYEFRHGFSGIGIVAVTTGGAPKQCHDAPNSRLARLPGRGFGVISPVCAMLAQRLH